MVHVMGEVKFDPMMISAGPEGVNHLERLQASCDGLDAQNDALAIENSSLREQLNAQRLRADTAEAERDQAKEERDSFQRVGIAAEQRIAELVAILKKANHLLGCYAPPTHTLLRDIDAALNPEAESHE